MRRSVSNGWIHAAQYADAIAPYALTINENIRLQLDLRKLGEQIAELADGTQKLLDVVGPVEIRFENRRATADAMVLPGDTEILLGSIPMEDLAMIIISAIGAR